jgi:hypothetical protein
MGSLLVVWLLTQNTLGTITGLVSDTAHAPIVAVSVQARNLDTDAVFKATSGLNGNYSISKLPPGRYQVSASSPGYKRYELKDIVTVQSGQTQRADIPIGDFISLETLGEDRLTLGRMILGGPKAPEGPTPRTADGRPDFTGVWKGAGVPDGSGGPELQPWAQALEKERIDDNFKGNPQGFCLPFNVGLFSFLMNRIIQSRDFLATINEYDLPGYRQVYLDGRDHPKDLESSWTGHSIGKWDGDTLVIDTIGFNDKTWIAEATPHTDKLHTTTRLRRPDLGHLEIETTYDDPGAFKKPWVTKGVAVLASPKEEIAEFICNENNQDPEHLVGK